MMLTRLLLLCAVAITPYLIVFASPLNRLSSNQDTNLDSMVIQDYTPVTNSSNVFKCVNPVYDCNNHGYCFPDGSDCVCDAQWATYDCVNSRCCYRKESRVKMFLLSFFVSWVGVPFFVMGLTGLGVGMVILCCGGCCVGIGGYTMSGVRSKGDGLSIGWLILGILGFLAMLAALFWSFAIWIMFAAETEPWNDSHGIPVAPWP